VVAAAKEEVVMLSGGGAELFTVKLKDLVALCCVEDESVI